jgi:hypothetical protein
MNEQAVSVNFHFRRDFIPKGCRNPRTEWFRAFDVALIKVIELCETTTAFKVTFPERPLSPHHLSRQRPEASLELLSYAGKIYWPLWVWGEDHSPYGEISLDGLDRLLGEKHDLFGFLPRDEVFPRDSGLFASAREVRRDDEAANLTMVNERIHENFLICDGRAYILGGQPMFVRGDVYRIGRRVLCVTHSGADRSVRPAIETSFTYLPEEWRSELRRGGSWSATDRDAALAAGGKTEEYTPDIQTLLPELVADRHFETTLDAIYADVLEAIERPTRLRSGLSDRYREILAPGLEMTSDADLSRRRFAALKQLFDTKFPDALRETARDFWAMSDRHASPF